jgi:general secretion pathway protein J
MNRQNGFTLVEILVAISVSALLISLVYGVVVLGQRSVHSVNSHANDSEHMRIGWQFIDAAIARAQPFTDTSNVDAVGFIGRENRLSFHADQPAFLGPGGMTRITLEVRDTGDHDTLVIMREPVSPIRENTPPPEAVLVEQLDSLELAYFGSEDGESDATWLPRWERQDALPGLVEVQVTPRNAPAWPVLIARPMSGALGAGIEVPVDETGEPLPKELLEQFDESLIEIMEFPLDV